MNAMLHWFTSPEWAQIVKALLHSLWQGAVVALVLAVVMRRLANPVSRYRCSLAALVVVVVAGMLTWAVINSSERQKPAPIPIQPTAQNQTAPDYIPPLNLDSPDKIVVVVNRPPVVTSLRWTAWLALVWLAGAAAMLTRAGVKVAGAEKLRRSCRPLNDANVEKLLVEARRAIGLAKKVRIGVTDKLTSPAVVGLFVPMLILPLSLLTTLTPEQIQFVLLHELAHIRRGDYLANLFQFFAESLLFFNPAVWWISHQVRREREACCDALAIELSGAPVDYARTLVHVAEKMLQPAPVAAMSLGNKREPSSLIDRVQRLLVPGYRPSLRLTWRAMLVALVLGSVLLVVSAVGTRTTVAAIFEPKTPVTTATNNFKRLRESQEKFSEIKVPGFDQARSNLNQVARELNMPSDVFEAALDLDTITLEKMFQSETLRKYQPFIVAKREWESVRIQQINLETKLYLASTNIDSQLPKSAKSSEQELQDIQAAIRKTEKMQEDQQSNLEQTRTNLEAIQNRLGISDSQPVDMNRITENTFKEYASYFLAQFDLKSQLATQQVLTQQVLHLQTVLQRARDKASNEETNNPPHTNSTQTSSSAQTNLMSERLAAVVKQDSEKPLDVSSLDKIVRDFEARVKDVERNYIQASEKEEILKMQLGVPYNFSTGSTNLSEELKSRYKPYFDAQQATDGLRLNLSMGQADLRILRSRLTAMQLDAQIPRTTNIGTNDPPNNLNAINAMRSVLSEKETQIKELTNQIASLKSQLGVPDNYSAVWTNIPVETQKSYRPYFQAQKELESLNAYQKILALKLDAAIATNKIFAASYEKQDADKGLLDKSLDRIVRDLEDHVKETQLMVDQAKEKLTLLKTQLGVPDDYAVGSTNVSEELKSRYEPYLDAQVELKLLVRTLDLQTKQAVYFKTTLQAAREELRQRTNNPSRAISIEPFEYRPSPSSLELKLETQWYSDKTNVATMVQDGKLLFEMGRLDQAEAKLKLAIAIEPDNLAARHYFDLIQETRNNISNRKINDPPYIASKSFDIGKEGNATIRKLETIRLDYVYYDNLPLDVVVRLLNEETKKMDPEKTGITFLIDTNLASADVKAITVTVDPPRINARVGDIMNAITRGATKPLTAPLKSDGTIVFSLRNLQEEAAQLRTMTFKIDTYTGFANLRKESGLPETSSRKEQLQKLFAEAGVTPPLTNILVTDEGMLVVRGTQEQMDLVNKVVEKLNGTPSNYIGTLTQEQMDSVNKALEKLNGTTSNNSQTLPVPNPMARTNLIYTSKARQAIATKLENIRLDSVHFDNESLSVVFSNLTQRVKELDPDKKGVSFILEANVASLAVTIQPAMTDVRLVDVLDAIIKNQHSIKYSVQDYGVVFSPMTGEEGRELYTRSFKVNPNTFLQNLENAKPNPGLTNISQFAGFFTEAGVDLQPPKSLFYNDRSGILFVRATVEDLDIIETVIQALNYSPPQINIKAEFIEVNVSGNEVYLGSVSVSATNNAAGRNLTSNTPTMFFPFNPTGSSPINANPQTAKFLGVLSPAQANTTRAALKSNSRAVVVSTPEVTTLSDRQAQIRIGDMVTIVNGINPLALTPPGITVTNKNDTALYILDQMNFGTSLDVFPHVSADGYTIRLTVIPKVTAFLGYDKPTNDVTIYVNGKKQTVPVPQPQFYSDSLTNSMAVWDGQTLVLGGLISESNIEVTDKVPVLGDLPGFLGRPFRNKSSKTIKRLVVVFITPTLIDPAGNRIHTEEDMPFAQEGAPVQTK